MEGNDELKLLALVRFDRGYLMPRAAAYREQTPALRLYTLAELFEGYFWIALGVTLEVFSADDAGLLIGQRFVAAFNDFPGFFRAWGYLMDAELVVLMESAMSQKDFFAKTRLSEFTRPKSLAAPFQSILRLQRHFTELPLARRFLSDLNFNPNTLLSLLRGESNRIGALPQSREGAYFAGFVDAVEYMGDCRQFYADLLEDDYVLEDDRYLFHRRTKALQAWRLNFRIKANEEAFVLFCDRAHELLPSGAARAGITFDPGTVRKSVLDLMRDWGLQSAMSA